MTLKPLGEQLVVQILPQKEEENVGEGHCSEH